MKNIKYKRKKIVKYDGGGGLPNGAGQLLGATGAVGNMLANQPYNENGSINDGRIIAGDALSGAASGAGMGMAFGPLGGAIGGALGLGYGLYKGITGSQNLMNQRDSNIKQQQSEKDARNKMIAEQEATYKAQQQDNWNKSYYAANPDLVSGGQTGSLYAYGGELTDNPPSKYQFQHGAFAKQSSKDLDNVWNSDPNNKGKNYNYYSDSTTVNGKPYYNYYLYDPNSQSSQRPAVTNNSNPNPYPQVVDPTKQVGYNGMLAPVTEQYGSGGSIHIKPQNKGKFTAYKKRTGKTTEEALHSSNAHVRQMANFARNASKWHHADGGELDKLASDVTLANGPSHEQGGITLASQGTPYAEIEGGEVLNHERVFSDRNGIDGKTYAEHAEKLGKDKGKLEKLAKSTNYRDENTAERGTKNIDNKLDNLFQIQELEKVQNKGIPYNPEEPQLKGYQGIQGNPYDATRGLPKEGEGYQGTQPYRWGNAFAKGGVLPKYGDGTPNIMPTTDRLANMDEGDPSTSFTKSLSPTNGGSNSSYANPGFNWNTFGNVVKGAIPFVDNAYNASLINQTPQIPTPNYRVARNMTAMPMKTKYNVDNQINSATGDYRSFTKNIDDNTSSSSVGRANKAQAFADLLNHKGDIYANKENIETGLNNQNNQNIQNVNNQNAQNQQGIDNQNLALTDQYNMAKTMRSDNILRNKASNVANAVGDAQAMIYDKNAQGRDEERMMLDAQRYQDGTGYARMIGTKTMDGLMSNPNHYKLAEQALIKSGHNDALSKFYARYGKK